MNSGMFIYQDSGLLDRTHIRWLTRITILDMFNANGYQVVEMISRNTQHPSAEITAAICQMARASGNNPEIALKRCDSLPICGAGNRNAEQ